MKKRRKITAAVAVQVAPGRSGRQTKSGGLRMRTWMGAERGRWWRAAAVWTGLAMALSLGACGTIRHATVGATPPDIEGARLDGTPELLSAYRGKVVLLDFWATWCRPCIASLPDLRQLVADLPADRFVLLAINVDRELETVTDFMENEPMPFAHWYVGRRSDVARLLNVRAFPTYILLDEQGKIVARGHALSTEFLTLIEETIEAATEA